MKTKHFLITSLILVVTAFLYYSIFIYDDSFKTVDISDSRNTIHNTTDVTYMDTLMHISLEKSGVDGTKVTIVKANDNNLDNVIEDVQTNGYVLEGDIPNLYYLFIDPNLSRSDHIEIAAHEAIHVEQFEEGRLKRLEYPWMVFEGDTISGDGDYKTLPWEKEAFRKSTVIERRIKSIVWE